MQALGYVHGARIIHAPEPIHGRLRYTFLLGFLLRVVPSSSDTVENVVEGVTTFIEEYGSYYCIEILILKYMTPEPIPCIEELVSEILWLI